MAVIAIYFDGALALGESFPDVNKSIPNRVLIDALKKLQNLGHKLIMWTCRENYGGRHYEDGTYLDDAIHYCEQFGLKFDSVNNNIGEKAGDQGVYFGRKIMADIYIDDKSMVVEPINWEWYVEHLLMRFGNTL